MNPERRGGSRRAPILLLLLALSPGVAAATLADASAELAGELRASQRALAASEQRINRERRRLAEQLNSLEVRVSELRAENAAARRAADERGLSIDNLESRLAQWREQSQYQRHLIDSYSGLAVDGGAGLDARLAAVRESIDAASAALDPAWRVEDIVLGSGELASAATLRIGPASWFLLREEGRGGLLARQAEGPPTLQYEFDGQGSEALAGLHRDNRGNIVLDPSLEHDRLAGGQSGSLAEHVTRGGIWVVPILVLGLAAVVVALGKALQFTRLRGDGGGQLLAEQLSGGIAEAPAEELAHCRDRAGGVAARLLDIALATPAGALRDDQLFSATSQYKRRLESWLGSLTVVAAVSPLLGLLGTVSGMIETFQLMTVFGAGDPEAVSGGISKALITTELGLVVAIPALLAHTLLSRWSRTRLAGIEDTAVALSQWRAGTASAPGAAP